MSTAFFGRLAPLKPRHTLFKYTLAFVVATLAFGDTNDDAKRHADRGAIRTHIEGRPSTLDPFSPEFSTKALRVLDIEIFSACGDPKSEDLGRVARLALKHFTDGKGVSRGQGSKRVSYSPAEAKEKLREWAMDALNHFAAREGRCDHNRFPSLHEDLIALVTAVDQHSAQHLPPVMERPTPATFREAVLSELDALDSALPEAKELAAKIEHDLAARGEILPSVVRTKLLKLQAPAAIEFLSQLAGELIPHKPEIALDLLARMTPEVLAYWLKGKNSEAILRIAERQSQDPSRVFQSLMLYQPNDEKLKEADQLWGNFRPNAKHFAKQVQEALDILDREVHPKGKGEDFLTREDVVRMFNEYFQSRSGGKKLSTDVFGSHGLKQNEPATPADVAELKRYLNEDLKRGVAAPGMIAGKQANPIQWMLAAAHDLQQRADNEQYLESMTREEKVERLRELNKAHGELGTQIAQSSPSADKDRLQAMQILQDRTIEEISRLQWSLYGHLTHEGRRKENIPYGPDLTGRQNPGDWQEEVEEKDPPTKLSDLIKLKWQLAIQSQDAKLIADKINEAANELQKYLGTLSDEEKARITEKLGYDPFTTVPEDLETSPEHIKRNMDFAREANASFKKAGTSLHDFLQKKSPEDRESYADALYTLKGYAKLYGEVIPNNIAKAAAPIHEKVDREVEGEDFDRLPRVLP